MACSLFPQHPHLLASLSLSYTLPEGLLELTSEALSDSSANFSACYLVASSPLPNSPVPQVTER
jgi:hypothetical protein